MPRYTFNESLQTLLDADGTEIKLRPQSLDVFRLLLENPGTVISKDVILKNVWGNVSVTDDSVTQCIADIRRALGEEHRDLLQTIPKKGYRLCPSIDFGSIPDESLQTNASFEQSSLPTIDQAANAKEKNIPPNNIKSKRKIVIPPWLVITLIAISAGSLGYIWHQHSTQGSKNHSLSFPSGPTLTVVPFKNASSSTENQFFSEGITDDIISALTRFSNLRTMSWNAVSSQVSAEKNANQIATDLGIRYMITGTVRRDSNSIRITVHLTDIIRGDLLWSNVYDEPLQEVFVLQDKISRQVVSALSVKLSEFETRRTYTIPTQNMAAYELVLTGRQKFRQRTRSQNLAARKYYEQAIELDNNYSDAYIHLGETYLEEALFGWSEWIAKSNAKALELANKAIELDKQSSKAIGFLARVYVRTRKYSLAQVQLDRAFELNPNDPKLFEVQGQLYSWTSRIDEAIESLEYSVRYDPESTMGWSQLAGTYYAKGRTQDTIAIVERGLALTPDIPWVHILLTAAYVEEGNIKAALKSAAEVRRRHPFFDSEKHSQNEIFYTTEIKQRFITSMRAAGLK